MRNFIHITLCIILIYGSLFAQVYKSGDIDGETWTAEDSLFIITDNISVIDLTIEPGVRIQFDGNHKFEVDGSLWAEGFYSDSIYFQPHPDNSDGWEGIKFKNTAVSSSLKYCRIEGASKHGIHIDQAQPQISNCLIVGSKENGIFLKGTSLQIQHCIIRNNNNNGIETDDSQVTVVNSVISDNAISGILSTNNNDIIHVTNVVIADNQDRGIDCPGGDLTVRNSIIYYNTVQIDSQDGNTNVTYSDIQGETLYPGLGNINAIPDFLDRRSYTLSPQSPRSACIDAGDPNFSYTDWFFPPSLGTSRNDMGAYGGPQAFGWYPPLYIKPQIYDFNRVTQDSSKTTLLNILNYRDQNITVSDILFEGNDYSVFSTDSDSFSIEIRDSNEVAVTFTPENERGYTSNLIFQTQSHGTVSIPISGEGVLPHIDIPITELNFGPVQITEDQQLELPIMNLGGDTLYIEAIQPLLSNFMLDKSEFIINPDLSTEIITVTFTPDSTISYKDTLTILSNDRDNPEIKVSLSGTGLGPVMELGQQTLDFDSVVVLADSVLLLNISNNGNDTLRIDNLTIEPSNLGFTFLDGPFTFPVLVEPQSSIDLSIQFNPLERGYVSADLSIYSNDPYQPLETVDLFGTGLAPLLLLSSSKIEFDALPLTADSTINLTVFNLGNDILQIDSLLITPSDDVFKMTDTTISFPYLLDTESNVTFPIRFAPIERGISNAQISLFSNDPFQSTVLIDLSGEGIAPGLNLSDYALNFGSVPIDSSSVKNLIIYNTLDSGLTVDSIVIHPRNSVFTFEDTTVVFPQVIDAEDSLILPVLFRPTEPDSFTADLGIFSDDPYQNEVSALLSGIGIDTSPEPNIFLSATILEFDEVDTNSFSEKNLYIHNTGTADLIIPRDSIYIENSTDNVFSIMNVFDDMRVNPQDSVAILIRFEPNDPGPVQNILRIKSNDPLNPELAVTLSGTGTVPVFFPKISLSTDTLEFEETDTSTFSQKNFFIFNRGLSDLIIPRDSIYITSSITNVFSIMDIYDDIVINPDDSVEISIRFNPEEPGFNQGILMIKSNDPINQELQLILYGTGVSTGNLPEIALSTDILEYNLVDTSSFARQSLHIFNFGDAILNIPKDSIYITGSSTNAFSIINITTLISISPQDSQEVIIQFAPSKHGPDQANLWIKSNDPFNPIKIVLLSGTGIGNGASTISADLVNTTDPLLNRKPAIFSFRIESYIPIDSAIVYVRRGGESNFTPFHLQHQSGTIRWSAEIDSNIITEQGVEYYVIAHQGQTISLFPDEGWEEPIALVVQIPFLRFPYQIPGESYRMISLPFSTQGQNLTDLFVDNLGPYDNSKYRIFECHDGSGYSEITNMDQTLPPGKAIWLISKDPVDLDVHDGQSVITSSDYRIELKKGWNMISTPFSFPINWIHLNTNLALRYYDGNDWPFAATMEPYEGYAVHASNDTIISIPATNAGLRKNLPKSVDSLIESNWQIKISAEVSGKKDHFNYVGAINDALKGIDKYDHAEPLPIGDYISVYLIDHETDKKLSTDFRPSGEDGYIYNIEMISNLSAIKQIHFESYNLPEAFDWTVVSKQTKVNYGKQSIKTSSMNIQYQLIVGTSHFIEDINNEYKSVPAVHSLAQNFPNPFNPTTFIKYELASTGFVELIIFNVLGQKVETLVSEKKEAGYHQIEWNASGFATGVYFYRIKAGDFTDIRKMILIQ